MALIKGGYRVDITLVTRVFECNFSFCFFCKFAVIVEIRNAILSYILTMKCKQYTRLTLNVDPHTCLLC